MAKDYFQDILPPRGSAAVKSATPPVQKTPPEETLEEPHTEPEEKPFAEAEPEGSERSIRNINITSRVPRRPPPREMPPSPPREKKGFRLWIWVAAALLIVILGVIALVAMRPTTIRVIPRSQGVVLDPSVMQFSAYPAADAPAGSLAYTVEISEFDESAVVPAGAPVQVEERASGMITVFNDYSDTSVRLIENTRFETPDGLIFRTPEDVTIPGKTASGPGQITITVVADAPGERYNIVPVTPLTLPGLRSTPDMYENVYARLQVPMTGGFAGLRPTVDPPTLQAAVAEMRTRLEQEAYAAAKAKTNAESVVLPDLIRITYVSLPPTSEGENSRLHEKARVEMPVFNARIFARTIARGVSADAEEGATEVRGIDGLSARVLGDAEPGVGTFDFTLTGTAQLIWGVDSSELLAALAGKNEDVFQAIVASFPGIAEAYARIQPFWRSSFPDDTSKIEIKIEEPAPLGT